MFSEKALEYSIFYAFFHKHKEMQDQTGTAPNKSATCKKNVNLQKENFFFESETATKN